MENMAMNVRGLLQPSVGLKLSVPGGRNSGGGGTCGGDRRYEGGGAHWGGRRDAMVSAEQLLGCSQLYAMSNAILINEPLI